MPLPPSGSGTTSYALKIIISAPANGPSLDITQVVDRDSIRIEETGSLGIPSAEMTILDKSLAIALMRGQWRIIVTYNIPGTTTTRTLFNGIVRSPTRTPTAIYGTTQISCEGLDCLLDRIIVKTQGLRRQDGGTDKARIQWLFHEIGQPLLQQGLSAWSKVQVLETSMPNQTFPPKLTLRQALERILAQSSQSANYLMDPTPRLWTWDDANPIGNAAAAVATSGRAPYDINATASPGAGFIAPIDLQVEWDSSNYYNGYYVQAANPKVSKFYTDASPALAMPGPVATNIYGDSYAYLAAPDADTSGKVQRIVKAALRDTRNPSPRIMFTV